jgi:hypothetical protein
MQSRPVSHLARILRSSHKNTRSWPRTAADHGVLTPDGDPNPGLAFRIAMKGYEPKSLELRERLGLPAECATCHRRIRSKHPAPIKVNEILDEPQRRVLAGAWRLRSGGWGSPEEWFMESAG